MFRIRILALGAIAAAGMTGCATGPAGVSDEEAIGALAGEWSAAMRAQDVDALMVLYSEDFSDDDGNGKADVRNLITDMIGQGVFENLEVSLDTAEIEIDGDTATYGGIGLSSDVGALAVFLTLGREDGGWTIVSMIAG